MSLREERFDARFIVVALLAQLSLVASAICAPLLAAERVPMSTSPAAQAAERLAMTESRTHDGSALETETQASQPVCAAHFVDRPFHQQAMDTGRHKTCPPRPRAELCRGTCFRLNPWPLTGWRFPGEISE